MLCRECRSDFLPWPPGENEIEIVASELLCRPCFDGAMQEFSQLKSKAEGLRGQGLDSRMIDRIMLQEIREEQE